MQKLGETYQLNEDSKASIQALGHPQNFNTLQAASKTLFGHNNAQGSGIKTIGEENVIVDIA